VHCSHPRRSMVDTTAGDLKGSVLRSQEVQGREESSQTGLFEFCEEFQYFKQDETDDDECYDKPQSFFSDCAKKSCCPSEQGIIKSQTSLTNCSLQPMPPETISPIFTPN